MITAQRTLSIQLLAFTLVLCACNKDDDEPATPAPTPTPTPVASASYTPVFSDADGALWAIQTYTSQTTPFGTFDIEVGLGAGAFSNDAFATLVNVGTVSLNGNALSAFSNNAYAYQPSMTNPTGIDVTSNIEWTVQGANGFPGFTRPVNGFALPTVSTVTSSETVVRSSGHTVACASVSGADSVIFLVGGVAKTLPGNATSCSFTASELSTLGAGANLVQIGAYRSTSEVIDGKRIHFGKETVRTKSVTIQ
jgi:hypothetical protein